MDSELQSALRRQHTSARARISAARSLIGRRTSAARRDDSGVTLVLALVFIVVGALALTALVSFAGGALLNTVNLGAQRSVQYAADGATDIAIQSVRYRPSYFPTPSNCLTPRSSTTQSISIDTRTMAVDCSGKTTSNSAPVQIRGSILWTELTIQFETSLSTVTPPNFFVGWEVTDPSQPTHFVRTTVIESEDNATSTVTLSTPANSSGSGLSLELLPPRERVVTFYTCLAAKAPCTSANAIVMAVVDFNDSSPLGHACTASSSQTCGTSMSISQWLVTLANR